jgi:hypothetical protein
MGTTEIKLNWSRVAGATGYVVQQLIANSTTGYSCEQIATLPASTLSSLVTGLAPGTTCYFRVVAANAAGNKGFMWNMGDADATTLVPEPGLYCPTGVTTINYIPVQGPAVTGSVFGTSYTRGPIFTDVQQGNLGDCWLLAAAAEVAAEAPQDLGGFCDPPTTPPPVTGPSSPPLFTFCGTGYNNGYRVGIYEVRLFDSSGTPHQVVVDTELPCSNGLPVYEQPVGINDVMWAALLEKAYAEASGNAPGGPQYSFVGTGGYSYAALNSGVASNALQAITGHPALNLPIDESLLAAACSTGQLVCINTLTPWGAWTLSTPNLVPSHCYAVINYNASGYEIYNPWGIQASSHHGVWGLERISSAVVTLNFGSYSSCAQAANGFAANSTTDSGAVLENGCLAKPAQPSHLVSQSFGFAAEGGTTGHGNTEQTVSLSTDASTDSAIVAVAHARQARLATQHSKSATWDAFWTEAPEFEQAV